MSFSRSGTPAPPFSYPVGTGVFTDVLASNTVFSTYFRGDGGFLSNVSSSIPGTLPNLVVSNSLTTTNVFATIYRGDGGLLTNIAGPVYGNTLSNLNASNLAFGIMNSSLIFGNTLSNIQFVNVSGFQSNTLSNLNASSLAFGVVLPGLIYGNLISNINSSNIVGTVGTAQSVTLASQTNITSVGTLTGLNVQGLLVASNGSAISNLNSANITQPFANLVVSNTVTTTNLTAAGFTSNASNTVFNYSTLTVPFATVTTLNVLSTANVSSLVSSNPISFRNRIINGGMRVWQRNTASISTTAGLYTTADRWCGALGTSGLLLSQWPGPTEAPQFPYSLQVTTSTAASGTPLIEQHIENLNIPDFLNGTPVTVSFYAGQPYGTLMPLTVGLYYGTVVNNFGTQTLAVAATQNTPTLTTANVYYSLSFTLTSSLGATNGLSLRFTTGAASAVGSTVLLTGVQVEKGSVPTAFEMRPYATELALCQRYYYQLTSPTAAVQGTSAVYAIFGTATGITTTAFWLPIQFPVPMRNPYYTFSNSAVTNFQLLPTGTTTITSVGVQSDSYTPVGATLNFVGTNIVPTASYIFRTNNLTGSNVAFFGFSCEL